MKLTAIVFLVAALIVSSCHKKNVPQSDTLVVKSDASTSTVKKTVIKKIKTPPLPKVLSVDDRAAKKAADGRLYYDIDGKRYWRNYDDGKYYLFNQKMFDDPAFKPH